MAKDTFLEAVATISAEDEGLRRAMKDNETVVKTSVNKMQGDLNRLNTTVGTTGTQAASTGQVFGAFGAQMSAVGGTAGMVGGKIASLGSAFSGLGTAILGLPGVILLATAALGYFISQMVKAKQAIKEAREEHERFAGEYAATTVTIQASAKKAETATRIMAASLQGPWSATVQQGKEAIQVINTRIAAIEKERDSIKLLTWQRAAAYGREITALESQRVLTHEQTNRKLQTLDDARRAQELMKEKAASAEHARLRLAERTAREATPLGKVQVALRGIMAGMREKGEISKIIQNIEANMPGGMMWGKALRQALGLVMPEGAPAVAMADAGGARGGGISPYAFAGGIPQAGGDRDRTDHRIRLEEKRTKDIERVADATERLERNRDSGGAL